MGTQYVYDRFGKLIGSVSDEPPKDKGCVFGCLVPVAFLIVIVLLLLSAC